MEKFNNTGIFTGYIKQVLHNFNLPKYRIYTAENQAYHELAIANNSIPEKEKTTDWKEMPEENVIGTITKSRDGKNNYDHNMRYIPYIKDGEIQEYINGNWVPVGLNQDAADTHIPLNNQHVHYYEYNKKILNYTKNLKITNNVYDSYTHEYLGDYLRFQRDYNGINLMPLYNCFSNRACERLYIKTNQFKFDTDDKAYKIYMLPVKLFKKYTIAIDSSSPIEMCCGLYGAYQDKREKFSIIPALTYKKITNCRFTQPFIYSELYDNITVNAVNTTVENNLIELALNENNLKLFLKVPVNNVSTIVILEGDYTNWNDSLFTKRPQIEFSVDAYGEGKPTEYFGDNLYFDTKNKCFWTWGEDGAVFAGYPWAETTRTITNGEVDIDTVAQHTLWIDSSNEGEETWNAKKVIDGFSKRVLNSRALTYNDIYFNTVFNKLVININMPWEKAINNAIIALDALNNKDDIPLISSLQLLRANIEEQCPYADRLVEYLVGNTITSEEDEIADNIKRAQKIMYLNTDSNGYIPDFPGIWDNRMKKISYDFMNRHIKTFDVNHDLLGYIDKDVEKYYTNVQQTFAGKKISTSILNAELTEEDFK